MTVTIIQATAGSGKTTWLVDQIKKLIPSACPLLIITFTDKAAKEIKSRLQDIHDLSSVKIHIGTFHSYCNQLKDPQFKIIHPITILKQLGVKQKELWNTQHKISRLKNKLDDITTSSLQKIYKSYNEKLKELHGLDFDDLIEMSLETLQPFEGHILIDEFQDTNYMQYELIKKLYIPSQFNLYVVGDIDQSIYNWRGAYSSILEQIQRDYSGYQTIKLEKNYRCTKNIIKTANLLLSHNKYCQNLNINTDNKSGSPVEYFTLYNEKQEAVFIKRNFQKYKLIDGNQNDSGCVLYRNNYQATYFKTKEFSLCGLEHMTVHAAKGLEFDFIVVCGLEDGTFPNRNTFNSPEQLEEERRLLYVAMTRARKKLILTSITKRTINTCFRSQIPSRFLQEMNVL